ncbi:MltA-interacting MipA [Sphingomonas yabuuchiae]|uniref:MltA-interacting MipA n=1 Tax=Sphingomonas yabuuchiae TaxID=172044 RepID=A0A147ILB0_9SPHN|nr:MipA/OmpV family protein [Sphingomonas yabuuchiae]KTT95948.1 MltA-interacting MipA [Sphingomonas yabuuchiae]
MRVRALGIVALLACPAAAQEVRPSGPPPGMATGAPGTPTGWNITIGAAPVLSPAWAGSRDMALSLFPDLRVNYGDTLFASVPDGIGWNAVHRDGWRAGPLVKIRFGRDERNGGSPFLIAGGSDALEGMGNIKAAGEIGGFVEKSFGPRRAWRARAEVRQGFGGHDGVVADLSAAYRTRIGRAIVSAGPRMTLASANFVQTYFGISPAQSTRTGLAPYRADGGVLSYGLGGNIVCPLNRRSALTLFTNLERLGGPAADSPLIRERGQRLQATLGLGYGFRFGL